MTTKNRSSSREVIENHLEAMRHELRERIWLFLYEEGVSSPKQIADAFGESTPTVSHHTKRLVKLGCAELVDERKVRGAIQHFYRACRPMLVDDDNWNYLLENWPAFADRKLGHFVQCQLDDFRDAINAGTLGRDDRYVISRAPVVVDAQGRDELLQLLIEVEQEKVSDIVQRSKRRRAKSGDDGIRMSVLLSAFESAPR